MKWYHAVGAGVILASAILGFTGCNSKVSKRPYTPPSDTSYTPKSYPYEISFEDIKYEELDTLQDKIELKQISVNNRNYLCVDITNNNNN